ncbi:hypothetical protein GOP47_0029177 [Adiantum capillus-veneris]|nr:hypothetical protein GOP47_0029177 [Adiantum capillus-veneris]
MNWASGQLYQLGDTQKQWAYDGRHFNIQVTVLFLGVTIETSTILGDSMNTLLRIWQVANYINLAIHRNNGHMMTDGDR